MNGTWFTQWDGKPKLIFTAIAIERPSAGRSITQSRADACLTLSCFFSTVSKQP